MKKINFLFITLSFTFLASLFSCSSDDSSNPVNENPGNTGELKLFLIDTAKVNTITATGTNETTILNKLNNLNSYISTMAIAPDGKKIAYAEYQSSGTFPNLVYSREIRMAKNDGTNDISLFSSNDNQVNFGAIKISADKVYFMTYNYSDNTKKINTVNHDGTGLVSENAYYEIEDISPDGNYFTTPIATTATNFTAQIIDRRGDNGAGGLFHSENFPALTQKISSGIFTKDGKKVVFAYAEGNAVKARIISMETKTSETVTLIPNFTPEFFSLELSMASDSNRGVITIADYNAGTPSKSYVFNLKTAMVTSTFNNNDDNIFNVYAY